MTKPVLRLSPLPASLALVCGAVGAVVVVGVATLALLPVVIVVGITAAWLLATLLLGWAGIEGMAALERWFERDARFQR